MMWPVVSLGDVATICGGSTPSRSIMEYWNGEIAWLTPSDLPMPGTFIADVTNTADTITDVGLSAMSGNLLPEGTVLFSSRATIGKIGISRTPLVTNQGFTNFIPSPVINEKYLSYFLFENIDRISALAGSTTFKEVTKTAIRRFPIPLPPLSEQRRIVDILDKADDLRRQRAEADENMQRVLPALFYKIFGDPQTNNKQLPIVRIGDIVTAVKRVSPNKNPEQKIRYIDIAGVDGKSGSIKGFSEMLGCEAPSRARQLVRANDVIVSTVRPNLRANALVPLNFDKAIVSTGFCVLRSINYNRYGYLYTLSRLQWFSDILSKMAKGASYPAVSDSDIYSLVVPYIDDISLHERLNYMVSDLNKMSIERNHARSIIDVLFKSILHRAFSGDLTAKWREDHMKALLQEMEVQTRGLGFPVPAEEDRPIRVTDFPNRLLEKKAILLAYIILRTLEAKHPIARVKLAKQYYFVNQFMQQPLIENFQPMAAGPLDNDIFAALELAQNRKWVVIEPQKGNEKPLSAGVCIADTEKLATDILGMAKTQVDDYLKCTKDWGWETLERWATIHAVALKLIKENTPLNLESIKTYIRSVTKWKAKLSRDEFSDDNIDKTIVGLKYWDLLPNI